MSFSLQHRNLISSSAPPHTYTAPPSFQRLLLQISKKGYGRTLYGTTRERKSYLAAEEWKAFSSFAAVAPITVFRQPRN